MAHGFCFFLYGPFISQGLHREQIASSLWLIEVSLIKGLSTKMWVELKEHTGAHRFSKPRARVCVCVCVCVCVRARARVGRNGEMGRRSAVICFLTPGGSAAFWALILAASSPNYLPAWGGCSPPLMFGERMAA